MAIADDLQSFLEDRLTAFDPTIDLSPNSPAQVQVISPTIARFAEDPFSTDISTFFHDRMTQEFPEMLADGGGMADDVLSKPFQLMFEPFKRQIQLVSLGQSINNASLMSDDEADALGANWFEPRKEGGSSGGGVRIFFAAPTNTKITTDIRAYTSSGLSFFPPQNYALTSQQMLFNRQGSFFFIDIVVKAENPGEEYNISRGDIIGVDGVPNVVKVTNLSDFKGGSPRQDNVTYLGNFDTVLTERSLGTKRGVLARVPNLFESVRALQVIGAGDPGMNRDILTGTGQGFLHLAGQGTIYSSWLWVDSVVYKDDGDDDNVIPQPGDLVRFHEGAPANPTPTALEARIDTILSASGGKFLFLLDRSLFDDVTAVQGRFALFKPGFITISNIPGGISSEITVPDNTVHLGGHTDVFVRPTDDSTLQSTLQNITDDSPLVAIVDLQVLSGDIAPDGNNIVYSDNASTNGFADLGVAIGDILVIETGSGFAGTYTILQVDNPALGKLRVDSIFKTTTSSDLRARIVRNIRVDLVSPKIPKLPFNTGSVSDLQTTVGSTQFQFTSTDIQYYGASKGDIIKILDGDDAGEFVIQSFPPLLGGQGAIVDRAAQASAANLRFEVYTKLDGLTLPLVRLQTLEVLDSTNQGTGITIPYGDAVDVRPKCDLDGAGRGITTLDSQLLVFPDLSTYWPPSPTFVGSVSASTDARYTQGLEKADGVVRTLTADSSNPIHQIEVNLPAFLWNGKRDSLMAFTTKKDLNFPTTVTGNHRTSDIAEAKIGDSITILDGPNQGQYIIVDHRVLSLWGKTSATTGHHKVALVQVDPPLKVDPLRSTLDFMVNQGLANFGTTMANDLVGFIDWATEFDNASGFYQTFTNAFYTKLTATGITFVSADAVRAFLAPMIRTGYVIGPSAIGEFRLYFQDPTSIELYFDDEPTRFVSTIDSSKVLRLALNLPDAQVLPQSETWTPATQWNRNLGVRLAQDSYAFLTSGDSFVKRGIQVGDTLEFRRAVNDLPSRDSMTSSWMCVTQAGSNLVQLIFPPSSPSWNQRFGGVDNMTTIEPGMLLFIDSGPDLGAYTITKIVDQTWSTTSSPPPSIKVQIDTVLTQTTLNYPDSDHFDFSDFLPGYVSTSGVTYPAAVSGLRVKFSKSTDGGVTFPSSYEFTFPSATYSSASDVVTALNANSSFTALFTAYENSGDIVVSAGSGQHNAVQVLVPSSGSAYGILTFSVGNIGYGIVGGATLPGTKRVYSSAFETWSVGDWITITAANEGAILSSGDDATVVGTYKVTATGTSDALFWSPFNSWIELDRTDNFPVGNPVSVRWLKVSAPSTTPATTVGGGQEISDQYVRVRLYQAVSEQRTITAFPWVGTSEHPLLSSSEHQVTLDSEIIDTGIGQENYNHLAPYRVLRPGVTKVSSTSMASNREGALYYVDVPVIGYGPGPEMNIPESAGFLLAGRRKIDGYTLEVQDENFSFSSQEQVTIVLPNSVLPVGSTADVSNLFNLAGQNIQVTYDVASLVDDLQRFFDSPLDRVAAANILVRHFLPAYVFLDASYSGGSDVSTVAADLISYINNIDPNFNTLRADTVQDVIKKDGATSVELPLTLIALIHGADRRIRGMRSTNSIGVGDLPFFKGTFNQAYFIAGPDTSKISPRPDGEQVFLVRS